MRVEVLNTGSELLLGQVVNTHAAYFGNELLNIGLRLQRQTTVPDGPDIPAALAERLASCDILLVTGGLGPTSDDLTRDLVAAHFGLELVFHPGILEKILAFFAHRRLTPPEFVKVQAMIPRGADVLPNDHGTAPGFHLEHSGKHVFCLPGPPRELHPMFEQSVLPVLRRLLPDAVPLPLKTLRVFGLGESRVQELVESGLLRLLPDMEIGYCARPGEVDLRLIAPNPAALDQAIAFAHETLGPCIYAEDHQTMEQTVVHLATAKQILLATAESCTGGLVAHRITNVPGASAVLDRGWVTYSNESKTSALGVPAALITEYGSVSGPVAEAMARGALEHSRASLAVSLTGIAGPDGGTPDKPVGLLHIGLALHGPDGAITTHQVEKHLVPHRETFKTMASQAALDMLRRALLNL